VFSPNALTVDARTHCVFVTYDDNVSMLAANGALVWTTVVGPSPRGVALDTGTGRVFVAHWGREAADSGTVSVLALAGGALLRTTAVGLNPQAVAVDTATRRVFVGTIQGVSVLDATSGQVPRSLDVGGTADSQAVDSGSGRLMVTSGNGSLRVFDTRTGLLAHMIPLPVAPPSRCLSGGAGHESPRYHSGRRMELRGHAQRHLS